MTKEQLNNLTNEEKKKRIIDLEERIEKLKGTKERNKNNYNHYFSEGMDECIAVYEDEKKYILNTMEGTTNEIPDNVSLN